VLESVLAHPPQAALQGGQSRYRNHLLRVQETGNTMVSKVDLSAMTGDKRNCGCSPKPV
jgi:hypothetical protein